MLTSTVHTWSAICEHLRAYGVTDHDILEEVRKCTAPLRHRERVLDAWNAAYSFVNDVVPRDTDDAQFNELRVQLAAYVLLRAEAGGLYGGGHEHPGAGTTRHAAFRALGKGRRQASDGPAWTAAIDSAAYQAYERITSVAKTHPLDKVGVKYYIDNEELMGELYGPALPRRCVVQITPCILDYAEAATFVHRMVLDQRMDDMEGSLILACLLKRIRQQDSQNQDSQANSACEAL